MIVVAALGLMLVSSQVSNGEAVIAAFTNAMATGTMRESKSSGGQHVVESRSRRQYTASQVSNEGFVLGYENEIHTVTLESGQSLDRWVSESSTTEVRWANIESIAHAPDSPTGNSHLIVRLTFKEPTSKRTLSGSWEQAPRGSRQEVTSASIFFQSVEGRDAWLATLRAVDAAWDLHLDVQKPAAPTSTR